MAAVPLAHNKSAATFETVKDCWHQFMTHLTSAAASVQVLNLVYRSTFNIVPLQRVYRRTGRVRDVTERKAMDGGGELGVADSA